MINFFRKIRKELADDNKPLKYMRYAIGEILLVVIGILIALQVNDWNEHRKSKNEAVKILKKLEQEFETNTEELGWVINFHNDSYQAAIRLENGFDKDHKIPIDSVGNLLLKFSSDWKFEPVVSVTNSAITSGSISLIENDSLTDYMNRWLRTIDKYNELHETVEIRKIKYIWPIMYEKYPMRNFDNTTKSSFEGDIQGIFSNLKNENIFFETMHRMKFLYDWSIVLQKDQEIILKLIEQELADKTNK